MEESGRKKQFSEEVAEKRAKGKEEVTEEDEDVAKMMEGAAAYNLSEGRRIGVGSLVEVTTNHLSCLFVNALPFISSVSCNDQVIEESSTCFGRVMVHFNIRLLATLSSTDLG